MEDTIQGAKKEVTAYESAEKSEENRHKLKMKKLGELKESIKKEIVELEDRIKGQYFTSVQSFSIHIL